VLAQLVALFATLHNALASKLKDRRPEAVFGYAQVAMQTIYHAIIVHDLLPRLLHPDMQKLSERPLWHGQGMPVEFTHGAFRVGHAMVRKAYHFRKETPVVTILESLNLGDSLAEMRRPLREPWVIDWLLFFGDGKDVNFSRRLSPTQSALDAQSLFRSNDPSTPENLSLRDMLSAALAHNWHVDDLIKGILAKDDKAFPSDWAWRDDNKRRDAIGTWLSTRCKPGVLDQKQISALAKDPPLPLFVLLEAALDPAIEGRHLGPLGSRIIGEVIGRSIAREQQRLQPITGAANDAFGPEFWKCITDIAKMPDLIKFAQDQGCLP